MSDIAGLAVQAVALKVLADKVTERQATVKAELQAALTIGDRKTAALADGTVVGSVTYAKGSNTAKVVDVHAFTEWVLANYPDEVVPLVRDSFKAVLLKGPQVDGQVIDDRTGEVVPGVEVSTSNAYIQTKPNADAIPALVQAIIANGMIALEAPGMTEFL